MITVKQNDTSREITTTLTLDDSVIDLTGCTVHVLKRDEAGATVIRQVTVLDPATSGQVKWSLVSDVAASGIFQLEWRVTKADTSKVTVPNDSYERLTIVPVLGT